MDIKETIKKFGLDFDTLKDKAYYNQSFNLLKVTDHATAFDIIMEINPKTEEEKVDLGIRLFESDTSYLSGLLKLNKSIIQAKVQEEDDMYNEIREVFLRIAIVEDSEKEEKILNLLESKLSKLLKNSEIDLVKDFITGNIKKEDLKKYNKLTLKIAKFYLKIALKDSTDLFNESINKWLVHNQNLKSSFINNLRSYLAIQDPLAFVDAHFNKYRNDNGIANNGTIISGNLYKKMDVPEFTYAVFVAYNTSSLYQRLLSGQSDDSFGIFEKSLKKQIKANFELFKEVMELLGVEAQSKLLSIMFNVEKNKTLEYILTYFINKTSKKLISSNTYILKQAYKKSKDTEVYNKKALKDAVTALLKSKKKTVKAIAENLLEEWK